MHRVDTNVVSIRPRGNQRPTTRLELKETVAGHSGYECRLGRDADECDVFPEGMPVENHENVSVGLSTS